MWYFTNRVIPKYWSAIFHNTFLIIFSTTFLWQIFWTADCDSVNYRSCPEISIALIILKLKTQYDGFHPELGIENCQD